MASGALPPGNQARHGEGDLEAARRAEAMKVTVTGPDLTGSYVVAEQRDDGTLVLRPETSEEVISQFADRTLSEEELLESFDRLHAAVEREEGGSEKEVYHR